MSTFGCHSCGVVPSQYKSYDESPCAKCKLAVERYNTHRPALFDSAANLDDDEDETLGTEDKDFEEMVNRNDSAHIQQVLDAVEANGIIKDVIERQVFQVASGMVLSLLKLAKTNAVMFEILIKKMHYPYMSYSEIGDSMNPKCSKQNVLYHLKHAVELFPDLPAAILTDTRFSGGRYALTTLANKKRLDATRKRVQGILYGDANPALITKGMKEIAAIVNAPFLSDFDVVNFNPYTKDEQ